MANLKSKSLFGALALAASLLLTSAAFAQDPTPASPEPTATPASSLEDDRRILNGDRIISGDNFVLRSGETLRGDLTIFGGNATLEENSIVEGKVTVFGGNADIAGTVTDDVGLVGGNVMLRNSAVVEGDLSRVGGTFNRESGAVVRGQWTTMNVPNVPAAPNASNNSRAFMRDNGPFEWFFSVITSAITAIFGAILISLLALAIVALLPGNVAQAATVMQANWLTAGLVGALTLFAVPIIAVILAVTICLIPVSLLLLLAYVVAIIAGWTVSARILGERVMLAMNRRDWTLIGQTLAGAVLLALLGAVPVIGGLIGFAATSLGLGALILTRAGTRPYPLPVMAFAPAGPISPATPMEYPLVSSETPAPTDASSNPPETKSPESDAPADEWWKSDMPAVKDRPSTEAPPANDAPPVAPDKPA